jgi:cold shock CspA family protein
MFVGTVLNFNDKSGYGYIHVDAGQGLSAADSLLVHRRSLRDRSLELKKGNRVQFSTEVVPTGILASDVHLVPLEDDTDETESPVEYASPKPFTGIDYFSAAVLARDKKRYDEAEHLFRKGLGL